LLFDTDESKRARGGFTAFIIKRDMPGLKVGLPDIKMGLKGSNIVINPPVIPVRNEKFLPFQALFELY